MTEINGTDRLRSFLVPLATAGVIAFNYMAATGRLNNVDTSAISAMYPTPVTPAGYAFSIWSLIYFGLIAFSLYQLRPAASSLADKIRSPYILSCALNCAWLYMWHNDQIVVCTILLIALAITLFYINIMLTKTEGLGEYWFIKAPFSIYFGWVTAASLVNIAIMLVATNSASGATLTWIGVALIALATALGVIVRKKLANYLYPLIIAWALTAIAVKQSGNTPIVVATAVGTIVCLIACLSFVVYLPGNAERQRSEANDG